MEGPDYSHWHGVFQLQQSLRILQAIYRQRMQTGKIDPDQIGEVLVSVITDNKKWERWSRAGIEGTRKYYAWESHVERYLEKIRQVTSSRRQKSVRDNRTYRSRLPISDRMLVCDIDNTLIGDKEALDELLRRLNSNGQHIGFGVATGRRLDSARKIVQEWNIPMPDFFISSVGCEIYYDKDLHEDRRWKRQSRR